MGVRTLVGKADGEDGRAAAAMYDSVTGWMVGPIFEAEDAGEQVEAFLAWLSEHRWYAARREIFGTDDGHRAGIVSLTGEGSDPRGWTDAALERLVVFWRGRYVGEDGWLLDPRACACGHRHTLADDDGDGGCASCACSRWEPGNGPAEERLRDAPETLFV